MLRTFAPEEAVFSADGHVGVQSDWRRHRKPSDESERKKGPALLLLRNPHSDDAKKENHTVEIFSSSHQKLHFKPAVNIYYQEVEKDSQQTRIKKENLRCLYLDRFGCFSVCH